MQIDTICLKDGGMPSLDLENFYFSKNSSIINLFKLKNKVQTCILASKITFAYPPLFFLNRGILIQSAKVVYVGKGMYCNNLAQKHSDMSNSNVTYQQISI